MYYERPQVMGKSVLVLIRLSDRLKKTRMNRALFDLVFHQEHVVITQRWRGSKIVKSLRFLDPVTGKTELYCEPPLPPSPDGGGRRNPSAAAAATAAAELLCNVDDKYIVTMIRR